MTIERDRLRSLLGFYGLTVILGCIGSARAPNSVFASKNNLINLIFVKWGWLWTSMVFFSNLFFDQGIMRLKLPTDRRQLARSLSIWVASTVIWYFITQSLLVAPSVIDHAFMFTGGQCSEPNIFTREQCRTTGGKWEDGHDISGHVFMLIHASMLLWTQYPFRQTTLTWILLVIWWWMLLMTCLYYHTLAEKISGLIVGLTPWAVLYYSIG